MSDDATVLLQGLIDRALAGDRSARHELLERACERLRRLAARIFNESFPALRSRHELDSIVHETWLKLAQAMETADPPTVADFFRLAAHKIRQVLLTMAEKNRLQVAREAVGLSGIGGAPPDGTFDPARLAEWTEFHRRVDALPADQKSVFEMHHYLGLPQAEVARLMNLHPRKVSYLWIEATEQLTDGMADGVITE
ncbi:MAG TPA: RNA polymerase sigma factor [Gemmataceae bacterium]|jgi:RNA polymerase sigma factor (sigma-70 family)|nr:RNA polymerase sigma factor [Gemmataceae bacterium]